MQVQSYLLVRVLAKKHTLIHIDTNVFAHSLPYSRCHTLVSTQTYLQILRSTRLKDQKHRSLTMMRTKMAIMLALTTAAQVLAAAINVDSLPGKLPL